MNSLIFHLRDPHFLDALGVDIMVIKKPMMVMTMD